MHKFKDKVEHEIDHLEDSLRGSPSHLPTLEMVPSPQTLTLNHDIQDHIYTMQKQKPRMSNTGSANSSTSSTPITATTRHMSRRQIVSARNSPSRIGSSLSRLFVRGTGSSGMSMLWIISGLSQRPWRMLPKLSISRIGGFRRNCLCVVPRLSIRNGGWIRF